MVANERRNQIRTRQQRLSESYAELLRLRQEVRQVEAAIQAEMPRRSPVELVNHARMNRMVYRRSHMRSQDGQEENSYSPRMDER